MRRMQAVSVAEAKRMDERREREEGWIQEHEDNESEGVEERMRNE